MVFSLRLSVEIGKLDPFNSLPISPTDHNMPVFRSPMSLKEARKLEDLVTLENEEYPDAVSVISVGLPIHSIPRIESTGKRGCRVSD